MGWYASTIFLAILCGDIPWNLGLPFGRYLQWIGSWNGHWLLLLSFFPSVDRQFWGISSYFVFRGMLACPTPMWMAEKDQTFHGYRPIQHWSPNFKGNGHDQGASVWGTVPNLVMTSITMENGHGSIAEVVHWKCCIFPQWCKRLPEDTLGYKTVYSYGYRPSCPASVCDGPNLKMVILQVGKV